MFFETLQNERDREAGVMEMAHHLPSSVNDLLRQFHSHALNYTKETLTFLVSQLNSEDNYYNLGAVLHHLQRRCSQKEFRGILIENDIGNRTASYLIAIYIKFNALKIPCPLDVPWRTLGEAVRIIDALNYQDIIQRCRESSAEEIKDFIKKEGKHE